MNLKAQIEDIVSCFTDGTDVSTILLKAQAIAFVLKNKSFSELINNEQNGWNNIDVVPAYRYISCLVKAKVAIPYEGEYIIEIPVSNFEEKIYKHISKMRINEPISKIENIVSIQNKENSQEISMEIPTFVYSEIQKMLRYGGVQMAWQYSDIASIASIVSKLKSSLLDFFLKLNEEVNLDVNFNVMNKKEDIERVVNNTIYAGIVHTGTGSMENNNSNVVGGQNNMVTISNDNKQQLQQIVNQIEAIANEVDEDRTDIADAIITIREELDSKIPKPKLLKTAFNGLKAVVVEVAVEKIIPLVDKGLEIISRL